MAATSLSPAALAWVSGADTGVSSMTIWRHMAGLPPEPRWYMSGTPSDPDDFGRCYRLLDLIPEWRPRMAEMAAYQAWATIAPEWERLTALYERDIDRSGAYHAGRSDELYRELHRLNDEATAARRAQEAL